MPVLEHLQPASVLRFFEDLCAIPHGSGNTKGVSDYCVKFAKERNLQVRQDSLNNVVIVKEASAGYENAPTVILQGHLDMVCEKNPAADIDMAKEPLKLCTDGEFVWAQDTTLGGDDGIAVAMALAILDDASIAHPRLEAVFTTDEETGMYGAAGLETDDLQGRLFLNMDSEVEGILTVSCAGGVRATVHVPIEWEETFPVFCGVVIGGLTGGHSGVEIDKGRANSNMLMGRLLYGISQEMPVSLCALHGGMADNAIASETVATFRVPEGEEERVQEIVKSYMEVFAHEYQTTEPNMTLKKLTVEKDGDTLGVSVEASKKVISALMLLPNGIQSMSMDIPGLVQTSLNLGVLRMQGEEMTATFAVRSSMATEKAMLCNRIECLTQLLGGTVTYVGDYPAWEYKKDSVLRDLVAQVYEEQTGKKPVIEAIHAGLECGIFAGKLNNLDCVSIGPNLYEIHTPRERMELASLIRTWELVLEVLRRTKDL